MNTPRTWHDIEIYLPKMHRRFFWGAKEKVLEQWPWYSFFWEPLHYSGSYGQIVVYIKLR